MTESTSAQRWRGEQGLGVGPACAHSTRTSRSMCRGMHAYTAGRRTIGEKRMCLHAAFLKRIHQLPMLRMHEEAFASVCVCMSACI